MHPLEAPHLPEGNKYIISQWDLGTSTLIVEIIKDQPNEKSKAYLLRPCYSERVSHHTMFSKDSKAGRRV